MVSRSLDHSRSSECTTRAKQDALDLWFSMPGEMSVDDFAAELGCPFGQHAAQLDQGGSQARPRQGASTAPSPCSLSSKTIRRVAEGVRRQAARETGLTPAGATARGKVRPRGARQRCARRREEEGKAVDEGKTRRASRPAPPDAPASSRRGCRRSCPTTRRRSRRHRRPGAQRRAQGRCWPVLKAGRRPSPPLRRPAAPQARAPSAPRPPPARPWAWPAPPYYLPSSTP